jgi:hypothetical protein
MTDYIAFRLVKHLYSPDDDQIKWLKHVVILIKQINVIHSLCCVRPNMI